MRHITWLASYPKSGNTWLRFIVFWLCHERLPYSSRELDEFSSSRLPSYISEAPPFCRSNKPKAFDREVDAPIITKTHASADAVSPLFNRTQRAIYVYRNPLDVLQSALNYAHLVGRISGPDEANAYVEAFVEFGGDPDWALEEYAAGTWEKNVGSWLELRDRPVLALKFEDLIADAETQISRIAQFLDIAIDDDGTKACAQATAFEVLKDFEQSEIDAARRNGGMIGRFSTPERMASSEKGFRFFSRGKSRSYLDVLTDKQVERAWAKFRSAAYRFGFLDQN